MKLDAIGIICSDPQKSIEFYSHFGLAFKKYSEGHYEATSETGLRVMLDSVALMKQIDPDFKKLETGGVALCFALESPGALNERVKKLKEVERLGAQLFGGIQELDLRINKLNFSWF